MVSPSSSPLFLCLKIGHLACWGYVNLKVLKATTAWGSELCECQLPTHFLLLLFISCLKYPLRLTENQKACTYQVLMLCTERVPYSVRIVFKFSMETTLSYFWIRRTIDARSSTSVHRGWASRRNMRGKVEWHLQFWVDGRELRSSVCDCPGLHVISLREHFILASWDLKSGILATFSRVSTRHRQVFGFQPGTGFVLRIITERPSSPFFQNYFLSVNTRHWDYQSRVRLFHQNLMGISGIFDIRAWKRPETDKCSDFCQNRGLWLELSRKGCGLLSYWSFQN